MPNQLMYPQGSQTKTFNFQVLSKFGDRDVFEFNVNQAGTLTAEAQWKGNAPRLTLILKGPNGKALARKIGKSPLRVSFNITQSHLKNGTKWKVNIVNFSRKGTAKGTVKVMYPSPVIKFIAPTLKTTSPLTKTKKTKTSTLATTTARRIKFKLNVKPKMYMQGINLKSKYRITRNYKATKQLQFVRYRGAEPMTYTKFIQRFPVMGKLVTKKIEPRYIKKIGLTFLRFYTPEQYPNGKVVIAVNSNLYPNVSSSINKYIDDIAAQGYFGIIHTISSTGTPAQLRNYLMTVSDIAGVVLVGNVPVAWYEHDEEWCGKDQPKTCHAEWPCDLFFMDLNGTWSDNDNDDIYDSHTGNTAPEIFLGRLASYTLTGSESTLVNDYFTKNHRFRTGQAGFATQGITFVDDDWDDFGKCSMDLHLDIVENFTNQNYTNAANYKNKLKQRIAWMQLCCHSWPGGHHFHKNDGNDDAGYVFSLDIKDNNHPQSCFHNLFCCSSANFTENNYGAGWYTFGDSYGLCTIGSSKTGSMLSFEYFYGALNEGLTIGEAMVGWWDAIQPIDAEDRRWHYGMTVIGDPLLNWRVGAIPHGLQPSDGSKVSIPGNVTFRWSAITSFGAVKYKVESDYWNSQAKKWKLKGGTDLTQASITINLNINTKYRWRVKAHLKGKWGPWSPWQYVEPL